MNENIYGGRTIPSFPFIFDKTYPNYAAATAAANSDGIMCGRYVLIQYCNTLFDYSKRVELENLTISPNENTDEKNYYDNFIVDNKTSYDRMVLQKAVQNDMGYYKIICCLHPINAGAYDDRTMNAVSIVENLNIGNGIGEHSIQTRNAMANGGFSFAAVGGSAIGYSSVAFKGAAEGEGSMAFGAGAQAKGSSSYAFGTTVSTIYPNHIVMGRYNRIPYNSVDLELINNSNNLARLYPIFEIGNGTALSDTKRHSGFILDRTNSIIHEYYNTDNPSTIKLVKGWKTKSIDITKRVGKIVQVIITVQNVIGLYEGSGTDDDPYVIKYNNCYIWGTQSIISSIDCYITEIDVLNNTITIKIDPGRTENEIGDIQGIYIENTIDTAPDCLYGRNAIMSGDIGYYTLGNISYAFGQETQAYGKYSIAEGVQTKAYGYCSHAKGLQTKAYGMYSNSEGYSTQALGQYSHASGYQTQAINTGSIAIGANSISSGAYALAAGYGTHTIEDYSTVVGKFNSSTTDIFTVGIGSSNTNRYDGLVVKTSGLVLAPCATKEKIKNDGDNHALVTKEYVENELNKYVDYIKEQGVAIGTMSYDASTGTASTDSTKNLGIRYFPIYWEKWASGKSRCYFTANFKPQSYSQGGAGGDANPTWDRYVSCQCTLDPILYSPESDLKTLGLSNVELFKEGRFPAAISLFGDQGWAFLAPYDNSPANIPGDNASDLSQYAIGETLVANSATYIVCPTFWLKEQYTSLWYQIKTGVRTFYCEIQGFWKHPLK